MRIEDVRLTITATPRADWWHVDVAWVMAVAYWETATWWREVVELRPAEPGPSSTAILRWRSRPWRPELAGAPADGEFHRVSRKVPAQVLSSGALDVAPDTVAIERSPDRVRLTIERLVDRLNAVVTVEPVAPMPDAVTTAVVAGHFGAAL